MRWILKSMQISCFTCLHCSQPLALWREGRIKKYNATVVIFQLNCFHNVIAVGGTPCRNGSKLMGLQPPTGISLECLKKRATKDMLIILFVASFLSLVSTTCTQSWKLTGSTNSMILYSHAIGPNAAFSSPEGAHGGGVTSPVHLVKPVTSTGSSDVHIPVISNPPIIIIH